MKTLFLALILGTCATVLLWRRHGPGPAPVVVEAPVRDPREVAPRTSSSRFPTRAVPDANPEVSSFRTPWEAYRADNLPAFIRLLRASGCPERSIRLFAVAAVGRGIQQRLEQPLRDEVGTSRWWRASAQRAARDLHGAHRRARQELDDRLVELIGETAAGLRAELTGEASTSASWLDADRQTRLAALRSRHASEIDAVTGRGMPGVFGPLLTEELRFELRSLRERQAEEVRVLLGPGSFAEYQMRESPEATFVRHYLPEARDEAEFRRMVRAALESGIEPLDARLSGARAGIPAEALPEAAPDPRERVLERFREASTTEEVAAFEAGQAVERERLAREEREREERSGVEQLLGFARAGGVSMDEGEARRLAAALEKRSTELEAEWGPPPTGGSETDRRAFEERVAREFEAVAVTVLGERGRAFVDGMRQGMKH